MPRPSANVLAAVAITVAVLLGGAARVGTADWGLPLALHVDEKGFVLWEAVGMEWRGMTTGDYRPEATVYGPLVYELAVGVKWMLWGGPDAARPVAERWDNSASYHQREFFPLLYPEAHYSFAGWTHALRILAGLLGAIAIALMGSAAWRLSGPHAGAAAAIVTAFAPGLIQVGHFYTADALLVPEIAMLLDACALLATRRGWLGAVYAGLALGLIAVTKMPGMLLGLTFVWALAWSASSQAGPLQSASALRRGRLGRWIGAVLSGRFVAGMAVCAAVYLAFQPWLWDGRGALVGAGNRSGLYMLGAYFTEREFEFYDWRFTYNDRGWTYWLTTVLPYALGTPVLLSVFSLAFGRVLGARGTARLAGLGLVAAIPSFLLVAGWGVLTIRHILPAVPGLILAAAAVLGPLLARPDARRWLAAAVLAHVAVYGAAWTMMFLEPDPRLLAARWLAEHAREGDVVVTEPEGAYTATLGVNEDWMGVLPFEMPRLIGRRLWDSWVPQSGVAAHVDQRLLDARYLVIGDFYRRRGLDPCARLRARRHAQFYEAVVAERTGYRLVAAFERAPTLGPIRFDETDAEALSVDFDHNPVWIYERTGAYVSPF